jgi:hypothetical protein
MNGKFNKTRIILTRALGLLAVPVTLSALFSMVNLSSPANASLEPLSTYRATAGSAQQAGSLDGDITDTTAAGQLFQSDWGRADPDTYAKIVRAFESEALGDTDLLRVECRSSLCRVVYQAHSDAGIQRVLTRQLSDSFNRVVTVHAGTHNDHETLVYLDIPSRT